MQHHPAHPGHVHARAKAGHGADQNVDFLIEKPGLDRRALVVVEAAVIHLLVLVFVTTTHFSTTTQACIGHEMHGSISKNTSIVSVELFARNAAHRRSHDARDDENTKISPGAVPRAVSSTASSPALAQRQPGVAHRHVPRFVRTWRRTVTGLRSVVLVSCVNTVRLRKRKTFSRHPRTKALHVAEKQSTRTSGRCERSSPRRR